MCLAVRRALQKETTQRASGDGRLADVLPGWPMADTVGAQLPCCLLLEVLLLWPLHPKPWAGETVV